MVGKTINYTSNTALPEGTEWIILGEDKDGSIMLTTSKPIENGFTLNGTAEAWLSYEEDIKDRKQQNKGKIHFALPILFSVIVYKGGINW